MYRHGTKYARGDGVTWDGCWWIAQVSDPTARPGPQNHAEWRLAVKRGRDGKDGAAGLPGPMGPKGKDGRDLTQMATDGSKW